MLSLGEAFLILAGDDATELARCVAGLRPLHLVHG
jgi:hypothetical protein